MPALGKNFRIYLGDSMNTIGCEDSCTVNVTAAEIITTTKGSGRGTNREYGAYDATINVTGVVFPYESESAAASAGYTDATFLHSYIIQAKKVAAKYQLTDGALTKFVIANWIIRSITFTGEAEGALLFDMELALDGQLYESANMTSDTNYDGPSVYNYETTAVADDFTIAALIGSSSIYFVVRTSIATGIKTVLTFKGLFVAFDGSNQFKFDPATGEFTFSENFADGDLYLISYDLDD